MQNAARFLITAIFGIIFTFFSSAAQADYDPIALYLTWQHSPQTTMTVHWISNQDRVHDSVEFQRKGETQWLKASGSHVPMPERYPFLIHSTELTGLSPDSDYYFRIGQDGMRYKFHTMPADDKKPIRFIVGGDIYHDGLDILEKMNKQAARLNPMFIIVGGDIAYNDEKPSSMPSIMPRWLDWLIAWKKQMVTTDGKLIPMVAVIGNHDVKGGYLQTPAAAPFFYSLFAFPGKQGYNVLDFGNYMSLVVLDSGHTHPIKGPQSNWLYQTLEKRQQVPNKFVAYHVAAFPSVRKFDNNLRNEMRKLWVPSFEKFGVAAVFEHHDHAYKRTHPILNNKADPKGIIYLGDGGWGVNHPRIPKNASSTWYLAKTLSSRNMILVTLHDRERHYLAINDLGEIIDETVNFHK